MLKLINKKVLVVGLGRRGRAACRLLMRAGSTVFAMDAGDNRSVRNAARELEAEGIRVTLGSMEVPDERIDLAVVAPGVFSQSPVFAALSERGIPVIGELELGFRVSTCLNVAIAGTNGKATTGELVERMLSGSHRKTILAGHGARPVCDVADQTATLDVLVLSTSAPQLETIQFFRPAVAVLLNLAPDQQDRYPDRAEYARAMARLFDNQQVFDWAMVQAEALAELKELGVEPRAKCVTFSAHNSQADIYLDRGLIQSRLPNWEGPLLDTAQCQLRGPHNAENIMAALAVGRALRLSLEEMAPVIKAQHHAPHRFELVAEQDGVQFINDSKATNPDALLNALLAARPGKGGAPNVWLIAGGRQNEADFHTVGPIISRRVKGAFLVGEAREKIRSAWSLFTPCTLTDSLLEAVIESAKSAVAGDVILLSPACSSLDQFQDYQQRGEKFCQIVKSISWGEGGRDPNITGKF